MGGSENEKTIIGGHCTCIPHCFMFFSGAEEMGQKLGRPNYKSVANLPRGPGSVLAEIKSSEEVIDVINNLISR